MLITYSLLEEKGACDEWLEIFLELCPNGIRIDSKQDLIDAIKLGFAPVANWANVRLFGGALELAGVNLYGCCIMKADFRSFNLPESNFDSANLYQADFGKVNLVGASFRNANLRWSSFCDADIRGADFRGADVHGANFRGAIYRASELTGANFDEALGLE